MLKTPETFEYQGKEIEVLPAVISMKVKQTVEEDEGRVYAETSESFKIYLGGREARCFNSTEYGAG